MYSRHHDSELSAASRNSASGLWVILDLKEASGAWQRPKKLRMMRSYYDLDFMRVCRAQHPDYVHFIETSIRKMDKLGMQRKMLPRVMLGVTKLSLAWTVRDPPL